jgi:hypothetical protein
MPCLVSKVFANFLEETFERHLVLQKRKLTSKEEFTKLFDCTDVFIDGTERPIHRPKNKKKHQKNNIPKKKKRHTRKKRNNM